jgi:hypothetical protein
MSDADARFEQKLIDGQVVTIPTAKVWREIIHNPDFLGAPVYLEGTRRLVTDLLTFVTKHPDKFRLGMVRSRGLRSWTVLPLLLIEDRLQRVHIEYVTCGQCGRRAAIANPAEPSLYFGVPDEVAANRAALQLPRVNCPNCGASLPRMAVWAELPEGAAAHG